MTLEKKALSLKRIGWLYPIFLHDGLLGSPARREAEWEGEPSKILTSKE